MFNFVYVVYCVVYDREGGETKGNPKLRKSQTNWLLQTLCRKRKERACLHDTRGGKEKAEKRKKRRGKGEGEGDIKEHDGEQKTFSFMS